MNVTHLRTNHLENPIGYQCDSLQFSWKVVEAKGDFTQWAQVKIASDEAMTAIVYESEKVQPTSPYLQADFDFAPGTRYFWTATVCDNENDVATSEVAFFETPKKELSAQFINAPFEQHPIFTTCITCAKEVKKASMAITALGLYEAYINGEKVGNEFLTPYFNDYDNWVQYQTYDITKQLCTGDNAIAVMGGNGWFKGRFGFLGDLDKMYGDTTAILAEITIDYADGTSEVIVTDESWLCEKSPIMQSSIYDGEYYDATFVAEAPVHAVMYDDSKGQFRGKVQPRLSPPVTKQEVFDVAEVITTPIGETVLDFAQEITGSFELYVNEPAGTKITLQFGEILQNDVFYNDNLRSAKQQYDYISNGKAVTIRPYFTFYGYRYVKIQGASHFKKEDMKAIVLHTDLERIGNVTTSNDKVNRLFLNALWGQKGNFVDVPTDCPQRDERMGWTGDAQAFCATACLNLYSPAFYKKYMYDMAMEQKLHGGSVPHVVPDTLGKIYQISDPDWSLKRDNQHGSCAWGDAATIIPWKLYCYYGDKKMLAQQYDNMKMWTDFIKSEDDNKCGGARLWKTGFHFADWLALDNYHKGSSFGGSDTYYVASAYYKHSADLTAKAAKVLGKEEDALYYQNLANEVRTAMQQEYFTPTGRLAVDTQTAMVLAICFDIVEEKYKARTIADLKKKLDEEKIHLTTGFVGTSFLCPTLSDIGLADYAYTLLLNEDYPSWLYEVNMGATTIWERWNSVLPDGMISDTGMNSLNHYTYGSIAEWMYRYMGGINSNENAPAFKEFTIAPVVDNRFSYANVQHDAPYGLIKSDWKIEGETVTYRVTVPFDTTASFSIAPTEVASVNGVPCQELTKGMPITLKKGSYTIVTKG